MEGRGRGRSRRNPKGASDPPSVSRIIISLSWLFDHRYLNPSRRKWWWWQMVGKEGRKIILDVPTELMHKPTLYMCFTSSVSSQIMGLRFFGVLFNQEWWRMFIPHLLLFPFVPSPNYDDDIVLLCLIQSKGAPKGSPSSSTGRKTTKTSSGTPTEHLEISHLSSTSQQKERK